MDWLGSALPDPSVQAETPPHSTCPNNWREMLLLAWEAEEWWKSWGTECLMIPDWKLNEAANGQGIAGMLLLYPSLHFEPWRRLTSMQCLQFTCTFMYCHTLILTLSTLGK